MAKKTLPAAGVTRSKGPGRNPQRTPNAREKAALMTNNEADRKQKLIARVRAVLADIQDEFAVVVPDPLTARNLLTGASDRIKFLRPLCEAARTEFPEPAELS